MNKLMHSVEIVRDYPNYRVCLEAISPELSRLNAIQIELDLDHVLRRIQADNDAFTSSNIHRRLADFMEKDKIDHYSVSVKMGNVTRTTFTVEEG